ncbi:porin, partial [Paraglaciecola sp.]|uniref:porin n=1 Tax=Paraglaciecola sp. TaxID=1920173 RepID=UPI0030F3CC79
MIRTVLASAMLSLFALPALANDDISDLKQLIELQKQQLAELEKRLTVTESRLESTADALDNNDQQSVSRTTIGGYGELHYNNITNDKSGTTSKEVDFHRFVLFFGHEFSNKTRFFSEFELEHSIAGEGKKGEIELEQAYIEHDINQQLTAKAGLFLIPVGIINETHEPPAFYGVERNPVEKDILPATWWEAGAALNIKLAPGLALDTAITSGLYTPLTGSNAFKPRSGRQKVSEANANDLAYTARLKYTAIPGLELAASLQYQSDLTQGAADMDEASAQLFSAHAIYTLENFSVRALYAQWDIDGQQAQDLGRDKQRGFY